MEVFHVFLLNSISEYYVICMYIYMSVCICDLYIYACYYINIVEQKRWQAVSLVDGQLRESLIKNETSSRLAAENNQKRCRRKLFGLF